MVAENLYHGNKQYLFKMLNISMQSVFEDELRVFILLWTENFAYNQAFFDQKVPSESAKNEIYGSDMGIWIWKNA